MSFNFPTETVKEGKVKVLVPKLEAFRKEAWEYAPSKAPVFYNPVMELNRDLAVLVLQVYQNMISRDLSVSEPLTGCGVRGVRFAKEVEGVREVVLNDINPEAVRMASYNVELNSVADCVRVVNEDANLFLNLHAAPRRRFDFIDVDPFGTPVTYLDSAVRALKNGGLLALTATDMAPLCGVYPRVSIRKYGGLSMRTEYCHELAVRLLAGCLAMTAAKHDLGVNILLSHSTDHYIRIYALVRYGAKKADESLRKMGYVLHCFNCFHRETGEGLIPTIEERCVECGSRLRAAGPLWLGKILDKDFCRSVKKEAERRIYLKKRVLRLLSLIEEESEGPATYYVVNRICDKLNLPVPPLRNVIREVREIGFEAVPTHFNSMGFRSDAPSKTILDIIKKFSGEHSESLSSYQLP